MKPRTPCLRHSAIEARHWGATYALYRFCNGMQLDRVLPPGPREYWKDLAVEHKAAPDHLKWMFDPDPFAAQQAVYNRQAESAKKKEGSKVGKVDKRSSNKDNPNEIKVEMASELRNVVESAILKELANFPEDKSEQSLVLAEDQTQTLLNQLQNLGFKSYQANKAVTYLSQPSALAANLLR